jgi:hypothetical protein
MSRPALMPIDPHIQTEAKFYSLARAPEMYVFISTVLPHTFITWCLGLAITLCLLYLAVPICFVSFYTKTTWSLCIICLYADFFIVMSQERRSTREACFDTFNAMMFDRAVHWCRSVDGVFHSVFSTFGYTLMLFTYFYFPFQSHFSKLKR